MKMKHIHYISCFHTNILHIKSSWIHIMENNIKITYQLMRRQETSYSLWSKILATLFPTHKIFHSKFQNQRKTMQALSVYRKGTVCVYIKCLVVISWKVTFKSRGSGKGHTLAYWFEKMMELGDASDKEAPPPSPRKREMSKYLHLQLISMLQSMQGDGSLQRGSITIVAKRFDMACSIVY